MRIRKEFHVKGKLWRVEYKWRLVDDNGVQLDGLCVPADRVIYLCHGLGDRKELIFLHELGHAIVSEYGFGSAGLEPLFEEMLVHAFAMELLEMFQFRWRRGA